MQLSYQAARTLTEKYYGREIFKKYYLGCSTAGRQGLVEAQRYPEDFDGIVSPFLLSLVKVTYGSSSIS